MRSWLTFGLNIAILISCGVIFFKISETQKINNSIQNDLVMRLNHMYSKIESDASQLKKSATSIHGKIDGINASSSPQYQGHYEGESISLIKDTLKCINQNTSNGMDDIRMQIGAIKTSEDEILDKISKLSSTTEKLHITVKDLYDYMYAIEKKLQDLISLKNSEMQSIKSSRRR